MKVVAAFGAVSVLLLSVGQWANAQTPAQMEYERQQREYRQQQEQQRQEQQRLQQLQNDNARKQQEEANRSMRQTMPGSQSPQYPSTPATPSSATSSGSGRPSQSTGTSERRYALPDHGYFVIDVPRGWKEQVRQPPNRLPPTIVLSPASGNSFQVLLTPTWPDTKDRAPDSPEDLRAAVGRAAQRAKSAYAAESQVPIQEIQGRSGPGFYFSYTERTPKPGAHKFVTTGIMRVGELSVPFTITSNENQAAIVGQSLNLLKTAVQQGAGPAAAAPPATRSGQTTVAAPATQSAGAIQLNSYYTCNGERVAVLRCRSDADDAYCSVQYPDRKSAATGGITPELAERRGELVKKLQQCQVGKS